MPRGRRRDIALGLTTFGLALLCLATGCVSMDTPCGFVELPASRSEFKAVTPDNALVWVRRFEDEAAGEAAFWVETLRNEFVGNRGYTLLAEQATTAGARTGTEFRFETTTLGEPYRYLVMVFTEPDWGGTDILVLEYTATAKVFDEHVDDVRKAAETLRTRW
ncbi:MAG: hypothetical protein AB7O52_05420 [Planctomycetota bacterium]